MGLFILPVRKTEISNMAELMWLARTLTVGLVSFPSSRSPYSLEVAPCFCKRAVRGGVGHEQLRNLVMYIHSERCKRKQLDICYDNTIVWGFTPPHLTYQSFWHYLRGDTGFNWERQWKWSVNAVSLSSRDFSPSIVDIEIYIVAVKSVQINTLTLGFVFILKLYYSFLIIYFVMNSTSPGRFRMGIK